MSVSQRLTTLLALLLAAVLVMTQTLGVLHAVTHNSSGLSLHSHDHDHDHDPGHGHDHHHAEVGAVAYSHFLEALFSSHQEPSDCRLYDQASHDGAPVKATTWLLPVVPPRFSVAIFQGDALARWAALFEARGPPLTV